MSGVVGRFAPTPSGRMHLGNAFTAVLSWLFARKSNGTYILRIEDLDPERCKSEYAEQVKSDLKWLGLDWDFEPEPQSKRTFAYQAVFEQLREKELVYPCFCTRNELHAASAPHISDGVFLYPGTCRDLPEEERNALLPEKKHSWRIKVPSERITFTDGMQGEQHTELNLECGDFIVRRSDGVFAYQLAVVVDDHEQGVNQIVRGMDLLQSTAMQIFLHRVLNYEIPQYVHIPLICAADGRRLSKRDRDLGFDYLTKNKKPEEVLGIIAFLSGILPEKKAISPEELLQEFSFENTPKRERICVDTAELLR